MSEIEPTDAISTSLLGDRKSCHLRSRVSHRLLGDGTSVVTVTPSSVATEDTEGNPASAGRELVYGQEGREQMKTEVIM